METVDEWQVVKREEGLNDDDPVARYLLVTKDISFRLGKHDVQRFFNHFFYLVPIQLLPI